MRKLIIGFLVVISFITLVGCNKIQIGKGKTPQLVYDQSTEKEEFLINLMGNKVLTYELKNLPKDKNYEILLTYEVYEKGEKIKEEIITGIKKDSISEKEGNQKIGINFQEDKIRFVLEQDGSYASGIYDLKEDLTEYSQTFLTNDVDLKIGTEFYIFYATSGGVLSSNIPTGVQIDSEITNEIVKDSQSNIFIKLSYKEK